MCKIFYGIVQGFCEGFNKGTAAGGAGFIKLHAVYGLILYLNTLHILPADVQDAVHIRLEEGSGVVVGTGLHFALVQH